MARCVTRCPASAPLLATLTVALYAQSRDDSARISIYARAHDFNRAILVEHDGRVVYRESFGVADRAFDVPNNIDTRFRIASITKLFTSTIILQLRHEGTIDLHATIGTYLPRYAGEGATRVTIEELQHHTSGIQNSDTVSSFQAAVDHGLDMYQLPHTCDELLTRYVSGKIERWTGVDFAYNNADYIILGKIIESVTGKAFDVVLRERLLQPLGMLNSGVALQHEVIARLAPTYYRPPDAHEVINDLPVYFENWYAAGAMYSTVGDLRLFANALFGNKLLKPRTLELLLTPGPGDYGRGLRTWDLEIDGVQHRAAYRPGSIMGANTALYRVLDSDVTIVILGNTNLTDLDKFAPFIAKTLIARR